MSGTLQRRTQTEFYDKYVDHLRYLGLKDVQIFVTVAREIEQAKQLLVGKCPKCSSPISIYVNHLRQSGPTDIPGTWVMYRCSTQPPPGTKRDPQCCDFMVDLIEEEAQQ